jgi:predicted MFS family arabinose efflux permease
VVYTFSFLVFGLCCIWSARATSYGSLLASRIVAAWFSGSAECVAPMTIADIFFLHERGKMTAYVKICASSPSCRDAARLTNSILECTQPRSRLVPLLAC